MEILRGHPRSVGCERVAHGLWVRDAGALDLVDRLRVLRHALPEGAVFSSLTAAAVRGWWSAARVDHPVFVAVGQGGRYPERRGVRVARLARPPGLEVVRGSPLAPAAETVLALARDLALLDLVPLVDHALRRRHCTLDELGEVARGRRRGAPALRRALPLLDERAQSPWESVLRVLHRAAEIEVVPQHEVRDSGGGFVARADLWLVRTRRIHEDDGGIHREADQHRRDLSRDRRLVEVGWQRCGCTASEVLQGAAGIIASADAVLGRGWQPRRLRAWQHLVAGSLHSTAGRARVRALW